MFKDSLMFTGMAVYSLYLGVLSYLTHARHN